MDIYDIGLYAGYVLGIICAIAAVLLPLIQSLDDPKSLMRTLGAVGVLVVLFFIGYLISDNDVTAKFAGDPFNITPGLSQFIGGMLISCYFLLIIAIISMFVSEITNALK